MDYRYHQKVLEFFYNKKKATFDKVSGEKVIVSTDVSPLEYSAQSLSKEMNTITQVRVLEILTSLRDYGCLNSVYNQNRKASFFWITDKGFSICQEHYYKYLWKRQVKEKRKDRLKMLFYSISTLGILTSIIYNISSTQLILNKIDEQYQREISIKHVTEKKQTKDSIDFLKNKNDR